MLPDIQNKFHLTVNSNIEIELNTIGPPTNWTSRIDSIRENMNGLPSHRTLLCRLYNFEPSMNLA